jgi:hypothetical protein
MHDTEDHNKGFQGKLWQVHKFGGTSVQNGKKRKRRNRKSEEEEEEERPTSVRLERKQERKKESKKERKQVVDLESQSFFRLFME